MVIARAYSHTVCGTALKLLSPCLVRTHNHAENEGGVDCVALLYFVPSMTYVTVSVAHKLLAEQCVVKTSILAAFGSRIQ